MLNNMLPYLIMFLAGILLASISQVILKKAAMKTYDSVIKEYLNVRVIVAYILFFSTTFVSIYAYKGIPLSLGPVLETTGYIYVTIFGAVIFKEKITKRKLIALGLIIAGIIIYALG